MQSEEEELLRVQTTKTPVPHYWPADQVPFIKITYCNLFQYLFGAVFVAFLAYIVFGIPWPLSYSFLPFKHLFLFLFIRCPKLPIYYKYKQSLKCRRLLSKWRHPRPRLFYYLYRLNLINFWQNFFWLFVWVFRRCTFLNEFLWWSIFLDISWICGS